LSSVKSEVSMDTDKACSKIRKEAEHLYRSGQFLCSESIFFVINEHFGRPLPPEAVRLTSGFPVGMGLAGCSCGALTGGLVALGLMYGRTSPGQDNSKMLQLAKELHDWFKQEFKSTCCRVLIKDLEFASPEHMDQCVRITGTVAEKVARMIIENGTKYEDTSATGKALKE
jgi:C_GCAxxG_C_C family probable redox protein